MQPKAQTSTSGEFYFYFLDNTYGAIYFKVPESKSGFILYAIPDIPKSTTLNNKAIYFYLIRFFLFK